MSTRNAVPNTLVSVPEKFGTDGMAQHPPPRYGGRQMAEIRPGDPISEGAGEAKAGEPDVGTTWTEVLVGACAGGAFVGGFAVATAAGIGVVGSPLAITVVTAMAEAMAAGCAFGVTTAAVSFSAVLGYRSLGSR